MLVAELDARCHIFNPRLIQKRSTPRTRQIERSLVTHVLNALQACIAQKNCPTYIRDIRCSSIAQYLAVDADNRRPDELSALNSHTSKVEPVGYNAAQYRE